MLVVTPVTITNTHEIRSDEFPFPALTFCSSIFAKNSSFVYAEMIGEIYKNPNYLNEIDKIQRDSFIANSNWCAPNIVAPAMNMSNLTEFDVDIMKVLSESRPSLEEFIHECRIKNQVISCSKLFTRLLTYKSFCYSFNLLNLKNIFNSQVSEDFFTDDLKNENEIWSLDNQFKSSNSNYPLRSSKTTEIHLIFKHSKKDFKNICSTFPRSFLWFLHLPSEIATEKFWIYKVFTKSDISIKINSYRTSSGLRKFSPTNRGCLFEDEKKLQFYKRYNKNSCIHECKTNRTLKECGCVHFSMLRNDSTKICTSMVEVNCSYIMMETFFTKEQSLTPCGCLPNCNRIEYEIKRNVLEDKLDNVIIDK